MDFPMYCHQIVSSFLCLQQDNKAVFPSDFRWAPDFGRRLFQPCHVPLHVLLVTAWLLAESGSTGSTSSTASVIPSMSGHDPAWFTSSVTMVYGTVAFCSYSNVVFWVYKATYSGTPPCGLMSQENIEIVTQKNSPLIWSHNGWVSYITSVICHDSWGTDFIPLSPTKGLRRSTNRSLISTLMANHPDHCKGWAL